MLTQSELHVGVFFVLMPAIRWNYSVQLGVFRVADIAETTGRLASITSILYGRLT